MGILLFIIGVFTGLFLIHIFVIRSVYGKIVGDEKILSHIQENEMKCDYNPYDTKIMRVGRLVVTNIPIQTPLSKFTIQNCGVRISRFSKSHKIIDTIYKNRPTKLDTII